LDRGLPVWVTYLLLGSLVIVSYRFVAARPSFPMHVLKVGLYCGVSFSAAVALIIGPAWHRPISRTPWLWLAASQLIYFSGDTTFYVRHDLLGLEDFPSIADPLYFLHYLPLLIALLLLIRRHSPGRDVASALDALTIAVGVALLSWVFLLDPNVNAPDTSVAVRIGALYPPVMDIAVLAVAVRLLIGAGRRSPAFYMLLTGMAINLGTNSWFGLELVNGTYSSGNFLDLTWLFAYLLLGACALHPSMTRLSESSLAREQNISRSRLVLLAAASLTAPLMLLIQQRISGHVSLNVNAGASATLFLLVIFRLAGLVQMSRQAAITDSLTGLYNRRFFEEHLRLETIRAGRRNRPLGLLILDVDRFKSVNDRHGHPAGDVVLRQVSDRLRATARSYDLVSRYGGEEFAVLAPDMPREALFALAERLRTAVSGEPIVVHDGLSLAVTVSIGVAGCDSDDPGHVTGNAVERLVRSADRALYRAKETGRDRCVMARPQPRPEPIVTPRTARA
jgi:diguanylate cyclase (GGDEF)-like protein